MCGIVFALSAGAATDPAFESDFGALVEANKARGPDSSALHRQSTRSGYNLRFFGSVLHLRGPVRVAQPVVGHGPGPADVLLWNGQAFEGLTEDEAAESDTAVLWERFAHAKVNHPGEDVVQSVLASIEGPWASLYFDAAAEVLYVSRDPLGRRSLLISRATASRPHLVIASSSCAATAEWDWEEITTDGIGRLKLSTYTLDVSNGFSSIRRSGAGPSTSLTTLAPVKRRLPPATHEVALSSPHELRSDDLFLNATADALSQALDESVRRRVCNIPSPARDGDARLAVLFSGGIDCTIIALLASSHIPPHEPIDLLNVAFENPRALANAAAEAKKLGSSRRRKAHVGQSASEEVQTTTVATSIGGVYDVPDRLTGREAVAELRRLRPERDWRFVEIDVPYEECQRETTHVLNLMIPSRTVMDLSLALALFFASRGQGAIRHSDTVVPYKSQAKVLLTGLGADEQLGGYARHRRAFEQGSWAGVINEIQLDIDRLPTRNLGRDDRIISSHSVEARYPYLSLTFIDYLSSLPIETKMDFRFAEPRSDGELALGDKMLLRLAARRLGLEETFGRKKRAMQFGARSAKMEIEHHRRGGTRKGWGGEALD